MAIIGLAAYTNEGFMTVPSAMIEINTVDNLKTVNMENEIWKDVVGYEGFYQVSNYGNVKSLKRIDNNNHVVNERILKQANSNYKIVSLCKNGIANNYNIHRLKAIAFIPNPQNKPYVNHRDGVKSNNGYNIDGKDNLEWCTAKENSHHANNMGLNPNPKPMDGKYGSDHVAAKAIIQCDLDGNEIESFGSIIEASQETKICRTGINSACLGKRNKAGGFVWKYKIS